METIPTRIKVRILENTSECEEVNRFGNNCPNIKFSSPMTDAEWDLYNKKLEWQHAEQNLREFKIKKCHKECECVDWTSVSVCPCKVVGSIHSADIIDENTVILVD